MSEEPIMFFYTNQITLVSRLLGAILGTQDKASTCRNATSALFYVEQTKLVSRLLGAILGTQGKVSMGTRRNTIRVCCPELISTSNDPGMKFNVSSIKVSGVRKSKVEGSAHTVSWNSGQLVCDCEKFKHSVTSSCCHTKAVASSLLSESENITKAIRAIASTPEMQGAIKLIASQRYEIPLNTMKKRGCLGSLSNLQRYHLLVSLGGTNA